MAMTAGTVTIDDEGNASGAGCARELFDDYMPKMADFPEGVPLSAQVAAKRQIADLCNSVAQVLVGHIASNAEVTVTVGTDDAGIQRMPATTTEDTPCKAPGSPVELGTKGSVV